MLAVGRSIDEYQASHDFRDRAFREFLRRGDHHRVERNRAFRDIAVKSRRVVDPGGDPGKTLREKIAFSCFFFFP